MSLHQFLQFNDICPVCGNQLTLFMSVVNSPLWKAELVAPDVYKFTQFMAHNALWDIDEYILLSDLKETVVMFFASNQKVAYDKTWRLFFYKICQVGAIEDHTLDYSILADEACYYRASSLYEFKNETVPLLELVPQTPTNMVNRNETFCFKNTNSEGLQKVYCLNLDYEYKYTNFWYYTISLEQRTMSEQFEPNYFEKKALPLLPTRPDLSIENRSKLLSKFDMWILLS
jgi:hypothetical protein